MSMERMILEYTSKRNFESKTVQALKAIVSLRLKGYTLDSVAKHLRLSKSRIASLERNFIESIDAKKKYLEQVKKAKLKKGSIS